MKAIIVAVIFLLTFTKAFSQGNLNIVTVDIGNFWQAYDSITATEDSASQYGYINKLFIEKGSPGLRAIMKVKGYTAKSYVDAINQYPLFWNSIRENTLKANSFAKEIETEVSKLRVIYPDLKPASIFFTIGALETGGTFLEDKVLIGSEIALADRNVVTREFPSTSGNLTSHFKSDPIDIVVFTNIHEYVHTQQKTTERTNLLAQTVFEGVAEFVAVTATGLTSTLPAISYGKENEDRVRERFSEEMHNLHTGFWFYNNNSNEFNTRDLGYYVGFAICEKYYQQAHDKKLALKEMIELDYGIETELSRFVDRSGYFTSSVAELEKKFEKSRPTVTRISQFKSKDRKVSPSLTTITVEFSTEMDDRHRNFELGPLGMGNIMRVKKFNGFSQDKKSVSFEVELKPNHHYQLVIGSNFRSKNGIALKPYLIDFTTSSK
ncbi:hypothetical protein [Rufibacter tibetensis]|nr:hypothetical protein [Rufibacter tibetensis]